MNRNYKFCVWSLKDVRENVQVATALPPVRMKRAKNGGKEIVSNFQSVLTALWTGHEAKENGGKPHHLGLNIYLRRPFYIRFYFQC